MQEMLRSWVAVSIAVALAGCGSSNGSTLSEASGQVQVVVNAVGTPVSTVVITVTAPDIPTPLVFNLTLHNGSASGVLELPPGPNRTITVQAFDSYGQVIAEASETRYVNLGYNNEISLIPMTTVMGVIPIFVSVGPVLIWVYPRSATLTVGESLAIGASVRRNDEQPSVFTVEWATANPAIATVTQQGVVTAVRVGETYIVAVSTGVAVAVPINVVLPSLQEDGTTSATAGDSP